MDSLVFDGALEIRVSGAGRVLRGAFPLGRTATLRSAGRVRKERFASGGGGRAVSWQVQQFEKLQAELSQVISSTLDDAARTLRVEALEDAIEKGTRTFWSDTISIGPLPTRKRATWPLSLRMTRFVLRLLCPMRLICQAGSGTRCWL